MTREERAAELQLARDARDSLDGAIAQLASGRREEAWHCASAAHGIILRLLASLDSDKGSG